MNALKRSLVTLALVAGFSSTALLAQPPEGGPGGDRPRRGMQPMSAEDRLKWLGEQLGITEEQKTQLKPIVVEEAAALKAVFEDKALEGDARREKIRSVRESFASKIEAILTPEQKAKFEKLKSMRGGPGGPGGPRGERKEKEEKK